MRLSTEKGVSFIQRLRKRALMHNLGLDGSTVMEVLNGEAAPLQLYPILLLPRFLISDSMSQKESSQTACKMDDS